MKRNLILLCSILFYSLASASVVTGIIGQGTFTDYDHSTTTSYGIDFDNDGNLEFVISAQGFDPEHSNAYLTFNSSSDFSILTQGANVGSGDWDKVQPLTAGSSVGSNSSYWGSAGDAYIVSMENVSAVPVGQDSYIGFRFSLNGVTHYGYAKIQVSGSAANGYNVQWKSCYYETEANRSITIGSASTGVASAKTTQLVLYPNPAHNSFSIQGMNDVDKVEIFNSLGVCVKRYKVTTQRARFDISDMNNGIYIVRIYKSNRHITKQLIKK